MLPLPAEVVEVVSGLLTIMLPEYSGSDRCCLCSVMNMPLQGLIGLLPPHHGLTGSGVCNEGCTGAGSSVTQRTELGGLPEPSEAGELCGVVPDVPFESIPPLSM